MYGQEHMWRTRCPRRKAKLFQVLEAVQDAFHTHPCTAQLAPEVLEAWQAWAAEQAKACQRSQGATAPCRRCITIIGVCPSAAPRSGRCCITSMVALQMGRRQPRGFSGRDFLTSLKRCYRMSRICPDLGTASRSWRSVVEVIR